MKQTVNLSDFRDAFRAHDRQDQFSYEALELIFDYYEEMDEDMELDVIAICCDLSESTWLDVAEAYDIDTDEYQDDDGEIDEEKLEEAVREYLNENTSVIGETSSTIIYAQF